jgi:chromosome partitioning protein
MLRKYIRLSFLSKGSKEKIRNRGCSILQTILKTVVIDTAPHAEQSALAAARSGDIVVIPCRSSIVDLRSIGSTIDICRIANTPCFVLLNQTPSRGNLASDAEEALEGLDVLVCPVQIGQRIAYVHSITNGQGVLEYEPKGKASDEINNLYQFILKQVGENHAPYKNE